MAGFFDSLFGSEAEPESRDYPTRSELKSPDESAAYDAGASSFGIPGLDYARAVARGVGKEISGASMAPAGELYQGEMDSYTRQQAENERLRRDYPEAYRSGRLRGSESVPGAETAFFFQPGIAGLARGAAMPRMPASPAPRSLPAGMIEGEFSEVPEALAIAHQRLPTSPSRASAAKSPASYWEEGGQGMKPSIDDFVEQNVVRNPNEFYSESLMNHLASRMRSGDRSAVTHPIYGPNADRPPFASGVEGKGAFGEMPNPGSGLRGVRSPALEAAQGAPEGMNKNVFDALMRQKMSGNPLTPFEQNMVNNYFANMKMKPTVGIHGASGEGTEAAIAPRRAADEAKASRVSKMPPAMQENMNSAVQGRLARGRDEALEAQGLNRRPEFHQIPGHPQLGAPYLESELPVVQHMSKKLMDPTASSGNGRGRNFRIPLLPEAVGVGAGVGAYKLLGSSEEKKKKHELPDMDIAGVTEKKDVPIAAADRPAKKARPAASKSSAPARKAPVRHVRPTRPIGQHAKPVDNRLYWGDWRDAEPFASDPIGNFIDDITGQQKTSHKPGRIPPRVNLGDLFSAGGEVRQHFAEGGDDDDRIPIVSDIGDAISGLFGGGDSSGEKVVAADRSAPSDTGSEKEGFFDRWANNPMSQFLFSAGLGMMASPQHNTLQAIGEGGVRGLEYMQAVRANNEALRKERIAREERRKQLELIQKLDGSDATEPAPLTGVPAEGAASAEPPARAPTKLAGNDGAPGLVTPAAAPRIAPEAPAAASPAAPSPVIATDRPPAQDPRLQRLYGVHNKISRVLPAITDPALARGLSARQKSLEFEINRLEAQGREGAVAARHEEEMRLREQQQRRLEQTSSPEYRAKVKQAETAADALQKESIERQQAAIDADPKIANLQSMKEELTKFPTGPVAEALFPVVKTASALTGIGSEGVAAATRFKQQASRLVTDAVNGKLGGGVSNSDLVILNKQVAGLGETKEANEAMLNAALKLEQRKKEIAAFERDYTEKHGSLDASFHTALAKWADEHPLFTPEASKNASSGVVTNPEEGKIYHRNNENYIFQNGKFIKVP